MQCKKPVPGLSESRHRLFVLLTEFETSIPRHGVSDRNTTPYPFKVTAMRAVGVTPLPAGPVARLVFASTVSTLAAVNVPNADASTITVRGSPLPLLSPGE